MSYPVSLLNYVAESQVFISIQFVQYFLDSNVEIYTLFIPPMIS